LITKGYSGVLTATTVPSATKLALVCSTRRGRRSGAQPCRKIKAQHAYRRSNHRPSDYLLANDALQWGHLM